MLKADITKRIHQEGGMPLDKAAKLLDWILDFLKTTLQTGESINISGFDKFTVRNKHSRPGRNPRTGEAIEIAPRRVVSFQASRLFKSRINSTSEEETAVEGE